MMKAISILCLFIGLCSCGSPTDYIKDPRGEQPTVYKTNPAEAEGYSYELRSSTCSTGEQNFTSFELACEGLKDEALNNDCALEKREELFINSECPGNFS